MMAYRYKFTEGKNTPQETWKREGKVEWPNMLDLELSRERALDLAEQLIRMARFEERHGNPNVTIPLVGGLAPNDDDRDEKTRNLMPTEALYNGEWIYIEHTSVAQLADEILRLDPSHPKCSRCGLPCVLTHEDGDVNHIFICPGVCNYYGPVVPCGRTNCEPLHFHRTENPHTLKDP